MEELIIQNSQQAANTFSWLMQNYEAAEGYSLPRCLIYEHYMDFCQRRSLDPVNAASFGKIIRQVFPTLQTRRLGTRGQSKYHYYGMRVRSDSPYYTSMVPSQRMSLPCLPVSGGAMAKTFSPAASACPTRVPMATEANKRGHTVGDFGVGGAGSSSRGGIAGGSTMVVVQQHMTNVKTTSREIKQETPLELTTPLIQAHESSLLPDFPQAQDLINLPEAVSTDGMAEFLQDYRVHCNILLEVITRGTLDEVDYYLHLFWSHLLPSQLKLVQCGAVCEALAVCDTYLYRAIMSVLIPGTLNPIPQSLLQKIRQFSYRLPTVVEVAIKACPQQLIDCKLATVKHFSQLLKRKTSLAHLSQASRSALAAEVTISQMRQDWEKRTEHDTVCSQLLWTMPGLKTIVSQQDIRIHMDSFQTLLETRASVEEHIKWVEDVRSFFVEKGYAHDSPEYEKAERAFFIAWCYVCNLIIRDQTLRSATSFGSFHLLNLFYAEYLLYVTEVHRFQRQELSLWQRVMGLDKPMAVGFALHDVDVEDDDCDDDLQDLCADSLIDAATSDDLFDDITPLTAAVGQTGLHGDLPTVDATTTGATSKMETPVDLSNIIPLAFAASAGDTKPNDAKPDAKLDAKSDAKPEAKPVAKPDSRTGGGEPSRHVGSESNSATTAASATAKAYPASSPAKDVPTFITSKLIRATLLPSSPSPSPPHQKDPSTVATPTASPLPAPPAATEGATQKAAPTILTLNVPTMPGLDLQKGQFLTAGDGNKYIINDVQTVLQPIKKEST